MSDESQAPRASSSARISAVLPVSPSRGKIRAMLLACASAFRSVIASTASVTLKPSSKAWRAVDSTPMLVATPARTIWVTPSPRSCASRSVPMKAPQVRFVTRWSPGCPASSGTISAQPAGRSPPAGACSVRPGAPPVTLTSTTGRSCRRNDSASTAARFTTSPIGCTVGNPIRPRCRSTTTSAVFGSRVVTGTIGVLCSSWLGKPLEERQGGGEPGLLGVGETGLDRAEEPVLARRPAGLDQVTAGRREVEDGLPPVLGIGRADDQPDRLERGDGGAQGLRADAIGTSERRHRRRSVAVEQPQHRSLRGGQRPFVRLLAQPALEPADQDAQLARQQMRCIEFVRPIVHDRTVADKKENYKAFLRIIRRRPLRPAAAPA